MKKIETTKTEVTYKCDFCHFESGTSKWVEEHEKQDHICKHENIYFRITEGVDDITICKKCKDCYLTLEIIEGDMDNFTDDDKQTLWDIFIKYKD